MPGESRNVRPEALEALLGRLGPVETICILQQYETGHGNYTEERRRRLDGLTVRTSFNASSGDAPPTNSKQLLEAISLVHRAPVRET